MTDLIRKTLIETTESFLRLIPKMEDKGFDRDVFIAEARMLCFVQKAAKEAMSDEDFYLILEIRAAGIIEDLAL